MFLLLFIAGLVLLFVGGSWFAGATTVGLIIVAVCAVVVVFQLLGLLGVALLGGKATSRHRRGF